ncbi:radical SAM peptide maturase [Bacteroidales bacterium OttesenSCG-928-L14]|nr:radical SAM peptide maturase [Bacteroidales bacterium OttesenSCG-928-L14]
MNIKPFPEINYIQLSPDAIRDNLVNLRQITFEVTDACNLKCKYCGYGEFYGDYDKRENSNFPIHKAYLLLDYLSDYWLSEMNMSINRHIYISFYGGEPLLNMDFIQKIIEYINKKNISNRHFTFSMTTNAMLLDKYMDYLITHDFNLLISLDGNRNNNDYRVDKSGESSFDKIFKNIQLLQQTYPEYFKNKVDFNAVLHDKNTYESIYNFIKKEFDKIPRISEINPTGIRDDMKEAFKNTYRNSLKSLYQSKNYQVIEKEMFIKSIIYQNLTTFLHKYSGFVFRDYNDLLYEQKSVQTLPTGTCVPFARTMFVTVNGKILPCERIGHQYALGYISNVDVKIDFETIAQRYNQYYKKFTNQCKTCYSKYACTQCIFTMDDLETSCNCYDYMNSSEFEKFVEGHFQFLSKHPEDYYRIMEEITVDY